uniref:dUTPase-like domain-containing protein n=1 Tax=Pelusios castaneus TaxID=367368 RepID=A0A8C8SKF5_9SAUR
MLKINFASLTTPGSAGVDLCALTDLTIEPGKQAVVHRVVGYIVPEGCYSCITPRNHPVFGALLKCKEVQKLNPSCCRLGM